MAEDSAKSEKLFDQSNVKKKNQNVTRKGICCLPAYCLCFLRFVYVFHHIC